MREVQIYQSPEFIYFCGKDVAAALRQHCRTGGVVKHHTPGWQNTTQGVVKCDVGI